MPYDKLLLTSKVMNFLKEKGFAYPATLLHIVCDYEFYSVSCKSEGKLKVCGEGNTISGAFTDFEANWNQKSKRKNFKDAMNRYQYK